MDAYFIEIDIHDRSDLIQVITIFIILSGPNHIAIHSFYGLNFCNFVKVTMR